MKRIVIRSVFHNSEYEDDVDIIVVSVPESVSAREINDQLHLCHKELLKAYYGEGEEGYNEGYNCNILFDVVCEQNGWKWEYLKIDAECCFCEHEE